MEGNACNIIFASSKRKSKTQKANFMFVLLFSQYCFAFHTFYVRLSSGQKDLMEVSWSWQVSETDNWQLSLEQFIHADVRGRLSRLSWAWNIIYILSSNCAVIFCRCHDTSTRWNSFQSDVLSRIQLLQLKQLIKVISYDLEAVNHSNQLFVHFVWSTFT